MLEFLFFMIFYIKISYDTFYEYDIVQKLSCFSLLLDKHYFRL